MADELGVANGDEDDLYRAMDRLLARQTRIESKLAQRHLREGAIVLYNVSSSFSKVGTCPRPGSL